MPFFKEFDPRNVAAGRRRTKSMQKSCAAPCFGLKSWLSAVFLFPSWWFGFTRYLNARPPVNVLWVKFSCPWVWARVWWLPAYGHGSEPRDPIAFS